jgi:vitamin B12 transporter
MFKNKLLGSFGLVFCMLNSAFASQTEEIKKSEDKEIKTEEVVVSASRIEEKTEKAIPFVQVIKKDDPTFAISRDVGDVMISAGTGHVHKYPGMLTGRVAVRGLPNDVMGDVLKSKVLVLIDSEVAGTANLAKLLVDEIERIEIVKGPASVIYGSQAMGGVINIITKTPQKEGLGGEARIEAGSWEYWKAKGAVSYKKKDNYFYLSYLKEGQSDYDVKHMGRYKNTGYNLGSFFGKAGFSPAKNWNFEVTLTNLEAEVDTPGGLYSLTPKDYKESSFTRLGLNFTIPWFKGSFAFAKDEDTWHSISWGRKTHKEIKTNELSLLRDLKVGPFSLVIGGDFIDIDVESKTSPPPPYYPRSSSQNFGIFTEGKLSFYQDRLTLGIGLREDWFKVKIKETPGLLVNPRDENFNHLSFRTGLNYKIGEGFILKTIYGTGFRAPTPDEMAADYVSSWGIRYLGNPKLKPEKSESFDFGFLLKRKLFNLDLAYFITDYKDKIITVPHPTLRRTQTYTNVDGAEIQGFELNFRAELAPIFGLPFSISPFLDLTYHTKYCSKDPREIRTYHTETFLWTPKWTGTFGITLRDVKWSASFYGIYVGDEKVIDWNYYSPTYYQAVEKKDFTVFNLALNYKPFKNVEIYGTVENLFNRRYEYVQYYPMPERTIKAGLKFDF